MYGPAPLPFSPPPGGESTFPSLGEGHFWDIVINCFLEPLKVLLIQIQECMNWQIAALRLSADRQAYLPVAKLAMKNHR